MSARSQIMETGFALISCVLILMVVLLLGLSAQQIVRESAATAANALDHQLALQAAEAALMDAEQDILQTRDATVVLSQPAIPYGSVTGNRFVLGGRMQTSQLPTYAFTMQPLMQQNALTVRYFFRITAIGFGARATTQVVLQSDFLKSACTTCVNPWQGRLGWREVFSP
jgi:type IV pilus assembly protein PilX